MMPSRKNHRHPWPQQKLQFSLSQYSITKMTLKTCMLNYKTTSFKPDSQSDALKTKQRGKRVHAA